ncbi:hypothetical protein VP01_384g4 [Puccinia sorghi]|uniref:Uncharacterized protein n=1 Tax=Puccinia sorghi TaxID=27349 RepID=A0A0L6UV08_9BASI|nr:hypothetical protein VP01_384g4 [Puccinia sorghi]
MTATDDDIVLLAVNMAIEDYYHSDGYSDEELDDGKAQHITEILYTTLKISDLIQIFESNSNYLQLLVEEIMMVTLKRLGCFGNSASVGMLSNFTKGRSLVLIVSSELEKAMWSFTLALLVQSIGALIVVQDSQSKMVQTTIITMDHEIATLLVCDSNKKIQYVSTGWPGCSHYH